MKLNFIQAIHFRVKHIRAILFAAAFMLHLCAEATLVVDASTGMPVAKASVFDRSGVMRGVSSGNGELPRFAPSDYPLSVSCLGFEPAVVESPETERVELRAVDYSLPELVVSSKKAKAVHLTGYLREYSTLTTYSDTVTMFREKTIDFMVPTQREKKYRGWTTQRVLASRSYYHFSDSQGLDSVSGNFRQNFSWSDLAGVFRSAKMPENIAAGRSDTDTVFGKYSPAAVWRLNGDNLHLETDFLADRGDCDWLPAAARMFSGSADFSRFNVNYEFSGTEGDMIYPENLSRMTVVIESEGGGRDLRRLFRNDKSLYMTTYAEIFITGREYLTAAEVKRWEDNPPLGSEIGISAPPEAPALPAYVAGIVERVESLDIDGLRLREKTDPKYHVMKKYEQLQLPKSKFKKVLNKILTLGSGE